MPWRLRSQVHSAWAAYMQAPPAAAAARLGRVLPAGRRGTAASINPRNDDLSQRARMDACNAHERAKQAIF